ncbi:hypothetical protein BVRB_9g209180 [Beta vulgaris subsp. vulgaris]|nr:hypothetical protein BVRB_9g209180 [Beta vulgaris subsp. vulgaris]
MQEDAKAKVDLLKLCNPSTPRIDIENEAFQAVINGHEVPERPQGYGFGVKKRDIHGVRGILRKEGNGKLKRRHVKLENIVETSLLKKRNEEHEKQNKEINNKFDEHTKMMKTVATHFSLVLDAVRDGKASTQLIDAAKNCDSVIMSYRSKRTQAAAASISNDVASDSAAATTSRSPAMIPKMKPMGLNNSQDGKTLQPPIIPHSRTTTTLPEHKPSTSASFSAAMIP